jgi:ABC-type dipeptide/oligopeptide/nickel transport system permease subunit
MDPAPASPPRAPRRDRMTRAGIALLAALACLGILAPCLAGSLPVIVFSSRGLEAPALRALLAPLPQDLPVGPAPSWSGASFRLDPPFARDPLAIDLDARLRPPGAGHWLGTDELGRDVLARLIHGTRPSLLVAFIATALSLALGIPLGALAGYGGGRVDLILSRVIEAFLSFPSLVLLMLLAAVARGGASGPSTAASVRSLLEVGAAIGVARWGVIARYMRGEILRLSRTDLTIAARAAGAPPLRTLARHLIPSGLAPVIVSAAFGAGGAVVAEASLSFLGLGIQDPAPTWGRMIASASAGGARYWWMLVFPGIMVAATLAGFNMLGEGLRRRGRP